MLRFEGPIPLTHDQLVRLSPVAGVRRTTIGFDEDAGSLRIWGLIGHGHALVQFSTGDPPDAPVGSTDLPLDCLAIVIEGPGALSVSRGGRGLVRLRGGKIVMPKENPLRDGDDPLGKCFRRLVDDLSDLPGQWLPPDPVDGDAGRRSLLDVYASSVCAVLDRIRSMRHGGSIVITRSAIEDSLALITYTVAEHAGLAEEIAV